MKYAPIALFSYNRPIHLQKALNALAMNAIASESNLYIFCDGPKTFADTSATQAVRCVARSACGFASVQVIEQESNLGLANSTIMGLNKILETNDRVIMVEDDNIVSPHFLEYINNGLDVYDDNTQVASIHGWVFPHSVSCAPETFFLRGGDTWGWGTWKRAWSCFEEDASILLARLQERELVNIFDGYGSLSFSRMLEDCAKGIIDSWAIRWHASVFINNMYTLYPGRTLVHNIGTDGTGNHPTNPTEINSPMMDRDVVVSAIKVEDHVVMRNAINVFFRSLTVVPVIEAPLHKRVCRKFGNILLRLGI